ncbi:hypothetical protein Cgig2_033889 [Carnegiea gigantea]|uniref:Oxidative stress 3 n=1 Tax=Carnegiea gigantea TaxID=171969 RepID=A0A9Q1JNC9_9CARY|nr:hypothetical protein Cgig2_033889 [Carnegiea gigantea]
MRKEAKRGFQPFIESQEAIEAKNCSITDKGCVDQIRMRSASTSIDSCIKEDSDSSDQSFSSSTLSSELMEDASSFSSTSSSSSSSNGPLYQLSDLMAQLPIKRGLSKYYQGKSESFASLASVENLEDLAKRENPYRKRIKLSNNGQKFKFCSPKATISKKTCYSRACFSSAAVLSRNATNNLISSCNLQDF